MPTLLLSGGGYGANWLPLIAPLAVIAILLYAADITIKFIKKRRHSHRHIAGDMPPIDHFENPDNSGS